ncbi:MAG TPA: hypothetical protein VGK44_16110 [Casimicrobiaceae bacterium]
MSRKALLWMVSIAWLQLFGHAASALAVSDAQADEFMRKSGLWQQLAEVESGVQQGITQSDTELRRLNDEQLQRLRDAARAAYGAERLRAAMRAELASSLPAIETEQALQFLATDLGKRVTQLEEAAAAPENSDHIEIIATDAAAALDPARKQLIERMVKATRVAEVAASIVINQQMGVMRGFAVYAGHPDSASKDDEKAQLNKYRDQMIALLGPRMLAHSAVIYGPLSDDDLAKYVAFLESPAGVKTSDTVGVALDKVLGVAAFELGRRIGDAVKPGDPTSTRT